MEEKQLQQAVHCQEIDMSSGCIPLALLKQAVAESPLRGNGLQDIGMVREGNRVLLKLYYDWSGEESLK